VPYYHQVWQRREYRLFLSAGPPKDSTGRGFNVGTRHPLLIRSHFVSEESPETEPTRITGGKDLTPGKEVTILERGRGLSTIKLSARFLTDAEAIEKSKSKPEEKE
jgi:hypothetical protein